MKRNLVLAAIMSLFVFAISASAQVTNFSGTWNLDVSKSKLGDRNNIESQTLTVTQTATDLKVETATKRTAPPAGAPAGGPPGGGGGRMGGGDMPVTYMLDGKEVKTEMQGGQGTMQVSTKAKLEGAKLEITRSITTPMGERTSSEKWWLNADGTLTIESTRPNRDGGTDTTTRVFTKKS